jgi:hypothetical protein
MESIRVGAKETEGLRTGSSIRVNIDISRIDFMVRMDSVDH